MAFAPPYLARISVDIPTFFIFILAEIQTFSAYLSSAANKILKIGLQLKFVCARQTLGFFDRYL